MNHEIPKPLRKALARQTPGEVHPSPDVLTAFVERTLPPAEGEVVTHHLAQCTKCREIVFLASNAAEDEVRDKIERELVPAAASDRVAAVPVSETHAMFGIARAQTPRPGRTSRMRWAASVAAAVVLVSGGVVLQLTRAGSGHKPAPVTVASNRPSPAASPVVPDVQPNAPTKNSQEASAKPPVPEALAKASPRPMMNMPTKKVPAETTSADKPANRASDLLTFAPAAPPPAQAKAAPATGGIAIGGLSHIAVPEVRLKSSLAESGSEQKGESGQPAQLQQRASASFGRSRASMYAMAAVPPLWRIGPTGQLERSLAPNQWTRALADQPITFRAVGVMGSEVWAGGNGGALFHSSDGGEHWTKVSLPANSNVGPGAIVSIHFDDPQHGVIASDAGTRWTTTDGGVTWLPQ
jgi:hypothetical protein